MLTLGVVFKDLAKMPSDAVELKRFFATNIATALFERYASALEVQPKAADPVMDDRGVDVDIHVHW